MKNCTFVKLGWGTIGYQCLGNESVQDVEDLEWVKITRQLSGRHGCGFYTTFYYDEGASGEDKIRTHGWTK